METKNKEINTIDGLKNPAIENIEVKNNQMKKHLIGLEIYKL